MSLTVLLLLRFNSISRVY